jgi:hypothetical protein
MKRSNQKKSRRTDRPTLPELDQTKRSVLNSLASLQSRRSYQHAMDEFIDWYCSEPRLALNRGVILRYRMQLETQQLAPATINVRLAAVRRLVYEAADTGLLSSELVAGIRRVKGIPQLGRRVGNWLTASEGEKLLSGFPTRMHDATLPTRSVRRASGLLETRLPSPISCSHGRKPRATRAHAGFLARTKSIVSGGLRRRRLEA